MMDESEEKKVTPMKAKAPLCQSHLDEQETPKKEAEKKAPEEKEKEKILYHSPPKRKPIDEMDPRYFLSPKKETKSRKIFKCERI
jgi:hypothetical protein